MVDRLQVLFTEVDRQLVQTQQHANTQAQRSGLVVSITALAAAVFVSELERVKTGEVLALLLFGIALVSSLGALLPSLTVGPNPASLTRWATSTPAAQAVTMLYDAKVDLIGAHVRRLAIMSYVFYLQVVTALGAVIVAIVVTAARR